MKNLLLAIALILIPSCSLLKPIEEKAGEDVAKLIIIVCDETDETLRAGFVDEVNSNLEDTPHFYTSACGQRAPTLDGE